MKVQQFRKSVLRLALLAPVMAIGLVGCGSDDDNDSGPASSYVRVLHASPDAPAVDVLVNGNAALTGVEFQQGSGYLKLTEGENTVALRVSGSDTIALEQTLTLAANGYYSVIAQDEVASLELEVLDDTERRSNGSNDVTVVHASPAAGDVDLYVTAAGADLPNTPNLNNVAFDVNATLSDIQAGDYQVRATAASGGDVVYNSGTLAIASDVTAVAVNSTKGASPVSLLVWADAETAVTPVLDNSAEVRIIHAVDNVRVDVFANGTEILPDFDYQDDSDGYLKVTAGNLAVAVAADGQGADNPIAALSGTIELERGDSKTLIAAGNATTQQLIILDDDRKASADTAAEVRLVHASSGAGTVDIHVVGAGDALNADQPLAGDVVIGANTGYQTLGGETAYDVAVTPANATTPRAIDLRDQTFGNGTVTTAIAVGESAAEALLYNDVTGNVIQSQVLLAQ